MVHVVKITGSPYSSIHVRLQCVIFTRTYIRSEGTEIIPMRQHKDYSLIVAYREPTGSPSTYLLELRGQSFRIFHSYFQYLYHIIISAQ